MGEEPEVLADAQDQEQSIVLPTPEDIELQVRNAVEAMNSAPVGSNAHLNAVRGLRELLSSCKIQNPSFSTIIFILSIINQMPVSVPIIYHLQLRSHLIKKPCPQVPYPLCLEPFSPLKWGLLRLKACSRPRGLSQIWPLGILKL